MRVLLHIVFISFLITGCSSTRFVEPLEKDQLSIGAGFGGPTIEFAGAPIPLPLTSIEVGYGLEGAIPDITALSIIDNDIKPAFKAGCSNNSNPKDDL